LDCYTRTHWCWKTATGWSHADFREGTLWRHIPALISLPKMLCNTYTQIKITKQKHSKLVIIKFALSVTHGFFHPSSLFLQQTKHKSHILLCCHLVLLCLVHTQQSIISSTSADASNRTHLVNMATSFSTQSFLLPQHIPQRENSNHGNHN